MLTSFFKSAKPATTIVVILYMTAGFVLANTQNFSGDFSLVAGLQRLGLWAVFILTMFILNFIAQKNELTKRTSYRLILFAAFATALPEALRSSDILLSGLFVMLALRRVISFRSGLHMERKIFDAGLWLCIATLVYFWSGLFMVILFVGLLFFGRAHLRYWFIPLLSVFCVAVLLTCYVLFTGGDQSYILDVIEAASFDFSGYSSLRILTPIAVFITLVVWTIWSYLQESGRAGVAQRPLYTLMLLILIVTAGVIVFAPEKAGQEWYFFTIPLAILVTSYLENASGKWFKELLLWIILLLPFTLYVIL